jgi:hypothetical protein
MAFICGRSAVQRAEGAMDSMDSSMNGLMKQAVDLRQDFMAGAAG